MSQYCYSTCNATQIKLVAWSVLFRVCIYFEYCTTSFPKINHHLFQNNCDWLRMPRGCLALCRAYPAYTSQSVDERCVKQYVEGETLNYSEPDAYAKVAIANEELPNASYVHSNLVAVRDCSDLMEFMDSFQAWCRIYCLIRFGAVPESSELTTVDNAFSVTPIKSWHNRSVWKSMTSPCVDHSQSVS